MKTLILSIAALALVGTMSFAQDVTRLGTEGAYPPYNFLNDAGEVDGFERELGDELCKRANLTCEWVTNDWDSIIPNLVSGNYDAIIAGMSITAERDEVINFTQDYYPPTASAYVSLSTDVDVTTGTVSAQVSTIQAGYVATTGATLLEFATPDETIAAGTDDIPGALIPERYFRYLREGDANIIEPVLLHNARDIVSLVRIADRVAGAVLDARTGRTPDHPPAAYALARVFERSGEPETAFLCYESAYYDGSNELRVRLALPYARALERRGEATRAVSMLETLLGLGLGSERWRMQAEGRLRSLARRRRLIRELQPA